MLLLLEIFLFALTFLELAKSISDNLKIFELLNDSKILLLSIFESRIILDNLNLEFFNLRILFSFFGLDREYILLISVNIFFPDYYYLLPIFIYEI